MAESVTASVPSPRPFAPGPLHRTEPGDTAGRLPSILACVLVLIALLFIVGSYRQVSQTWDEPAHIGTGMEWLARGTYTLDLIDPPLPRISTAIGPYLLGSRPSAEIAGRKNLEGINPWTEGNRIIDASRDPHKTLIAARLGILPYFLIAALLTWRMTRRWLGAWPALVAIAFFTTCPPILAHSALATTDMAFAAMFLLALDRLWIVLDKPTALHALLAGVAVGLACLSKLSGIPYVALCTMAFLAYFIFVRRTAPRIQFWGLAILAFFLTIWAGYHFDIGAMGTRDAQTQAHVQHLLNKFGPLRAPAAFFAGHIPGYDFIESLREASYMKAHPPMGYLFGRTYYGGLWYFFLVILLVKTPIPFLLLGVPGIALAVHRLWKANDGWALVPLAGIFFPVLVATLSHVNLGVRHVLVVYPFLAMLAALSFLKLHSIAKPRWFGSAIVALLAGWQLLSCFYISPDFLTYLNEPAAPYTGYIATDSDLDWGQDIGRLSARMKQVNAQHLWIAYSGSADLSREGLPPWDNLETWEASHPGQHVTGWVAVSETWARWYPEKYGWLLPQYRVGTAGRTIRIYYVP
ncbi:ArnT family glycosyltransferase [Silvibacterium sp.]|uniref:ArnT family glycosyltransferase n=1 Tax=Silvibacterium sp. TaxID=1964179 RepID=UPI0039E4C85A